MLERDYQSKLIQKIKQRWPDAVILKNDATYIQGIPDLLILHQDCWAALETKKSEKERHRPNQDYYVSKLHNMSYAAFIYPENERSILDEIQRAFESDRAARIPERE